MSKELTPLEALKDLREDAKHHLDHHIKYLNERLDIIEKALKENERLRTSYLENLLNEESKEYIYKELKALEIIKKYANKYGIHIDFNKVMRATVKNFDYTTMTWTIDEKILEEYELLKEVLL